MDPQHTRLFFDCRPMKSAAHHVLNEFEAGRLGLTEAGRRLGELAASLPDLNPVEYRRHHERLLVGHNVDRARRLVDCIDDQTFRAWVIPTVTAAWFCAKWGAFFGAVALVVWLVTR